MDPLLLPFCSSTPLFLHPRTIRGPHIWSTANLPAISVSSRHSLTSLKCWLGNGDCTEESMDGEAAVAECDLNDSGAYHRRPQIWRHYSHPPSNKLHLPLPPLSPAEHGGFACSVYSLRHALVAFTSGGADAIEHQERVLRVALRVADGQQTAVQAHGGAVGADSVHAPQLERVLAHGAKTVVPRLESVYNSSRSSALRVRWLQGMECKLCRSRTLLAPHRRQAPDSLWCGRASAGHFLYGRSAVDSATARQRDCLADKQLTRREKTELTRRPEMFILHV
ncbi:hypothetical protein DFH06DRAFT_1150442 [Mycena polygramma]|nr:hypothetical protein DFH06DRAFT_1150442 [Mycena polygramma]